MLAKITSDLHEQSINCEMISHPRNPVSISLVVQEKDAEKIAEIFHKKYSEVAYLLKK